MEVTSNDRTRLTRKRLCRAKFLRYPSTLRAEAYPTFETPRLTRIRSGEAGPLPKQKAQNILITLIASILSRFSGLATQFITAWYLTPDEFGLYAIALGIITFTHLMRGGGTSIVYQSMKVDEYTRSGGGLFRFALIFGCLGALLTTGAALPAQNYFNQPALGKLLLWMAGLSLLTQVSTYPRAKMVSLLRFKQLASIDVVGAVVKLATAYICASSGWGALTFVVAQVAALLLQFALSCIWAEFKRSDFVAQPDWMTHTFSLVKWPMAISVIISLMEQVDSFIASLFVPIGSLGVYFFAVQIVAQPIRLITQTLVGVLAPYGALVRGNRKLESASLTTAFTAGLVFLPLCVLSIAAVYPSLERLVWGAKWEASIWPVMLTSIFLVYPTVQGVLEGPILGMRRWTTYLELISWRAGGKIIGAFAAVFVIKWFELTGPSIAIALVIGVGAAGSISGYIQIRKHLLATGSDREMVHYELWATPLYALLAVVATHGLMTSIMTHLSLDAYGVRIEATVELVLSAMLYGAIAMTLLRFAYIENLKSVLFLVPLRWRVRICKVLVIDDYELTHNPLQH